MWFPAGMGIIPSKLLVKVERVSLLIVFPGVGLNPGNGIVSKALSKDAKGTEDSAHWFCQTESTPVYIKTVILKIATITPCRTTET